MTRFALFATIAAAALSGCVSASAPAAFTSRTPAEPVQSSDSYYVAARAAVDGRIEARGMQPAKNVILFVGDGMGVSTITAARIWAGQQHGVDGESYRLAMETLPFSAMVKTYTHDAQVADSAPTAAAMTTGVKSANGTIGVTQNASRRDCRSGAENGTTSLWQIAENTGLATGFVTTTRITHATPAATYAITTERDWESDNDVSEAGKAAGCLDIAAQFLAWRHGDGMEIALGGGRAQFTPEGAADPEYPNRAGARQDGRNLVEEWKALDQRRVYVTNAAEFAAVDFSSDVQVLGLFEPSHMRYELDRADDPAGEPSIEEMTRAAITRLSRNDNGYVLMVEGGRIDHAHHAGNAARALADTAAFDAAIAAALEMTDPAETLIIVTADHSHTLTIQGYPARNQPILGLARSGVGAVMRGRDGKPYTTLGYANGPGAICPPGEDACVRPDPSQADTTDRDYLQQSTVPMGSETHAGEDVALFASGPGSHLFSGVIEQNEIFHVMGRSLGLVE